MSPPSRQNERRVPEAVELGVTPVISQGLPVGLDVAHVVEHPVDDIAHPLATPPLISLLLCTAPELRVRIPPSPECTVRPDVSLELAELHCTA